MAVCCSTPAFAHYAIPATVLCRPLLRRRSLRAGRPERQEKRAAHGPHTLQAPQSLLRQHSDRRAGWRPGAPASPRPRPRRASSCLARRPRCLPSSVRAARSRESPARAGGGVSFGGCLARRGAPAPASPALPPTCAPAVYEIQSTGEDGITKYFKKPWVSEQRALRGCGGADAAQGVSGRAAGGTPRGPRAPRASSLQKRRASFAPCSSRRP